MNTSSGSATPVAAAKKQRSLLPLLVVVFIFAYTLMTLLIVEQNTVVQSQRNLIKVLLPDSREFWAMKAKGAANNASCPPQPTVPATQMPSESQRLPSTQAPSSQTPSTQAPAAKSPRHRTETPGGKGARPHVEGPPIPASDLSDQRRSLNSI